MVTTPARGEGREGRSCPRGGGHTRYYALPARTEAVASDSIITGMDWLSPHYAILDYHAKTVTLAMPGLPWLERRGTLNYTPSRVISFLKAQRMVEKGCDVYLAYVRDVSIDTPIIESVPVVRDYPDVFPVDLPGMPPGSDIDFDIDLLPGTQPISIPPYRMASCELKDLKEQLQ
ncbi:uncharacterized protein [Nicotiana sylvestris]|uniref:uncharacterized protein n=1 Tax=Nicotiana sylvestris TaxID=4096 RepID=UPI00388CD6EB